MIDRTSCVALFYPRNTNIFFQLFSSFVYVLLCSHNLKYTNDYNYNYTKCSLMTFSTNLSYGTVNMFFTNPSTLPFTIQKWNIYLLTKAVYHLVSSSLRCIVRVTKSFTGVLIRQRLAYIYLVQRDGCAI